MKLPENFTQGAELRDRNTNGRVRITAINSPHPRTGNPRQGFTWINLAGTRPGDKDHEGFCPASCAGCFEVIPPPTTWAQRNLPTWWAWRQRKAEKSRQSIEVPTHNLYGKSSEKFSDQTRNSTDWTLPGLYTVHKLQRSDDDTPTLEQQLAAMIAGGTMWRKDWSPGMMINETELASDALAVAREIISQSEKI